MRSDKLIVATAVLFAVASLPAGIAGAADESKVKAATQQVETGAKKVGEGVEETVKGIGKTVVEGAKVTGERLKESGEAAEPQAKSAWAKVRDGAVSFGQSVKSFFASLFSSS